MAHIVIQAGHYPRRSGSTGTSGVDADPTEQEFTIEAAHACAHHLHNAGHHGHVVWADPPLAEYRGDAFVAIHCDGSVNPSAQGASVGYRTDEGRDLATRWKHAYHRQGWTGGWRPDNYTSALSGYYGTRNAVSQGNRRAFIAEAGFLTNVQNEQLLTPPYGPQRFAAAFCEAIVEIFGGILPTPVPPPIPLVEEDDMFIITNQDEDLGIWVLHGEMFLHLSSTDTVMSMMASGVKSQVWDNQDFRALIEYKNVDERTLHAAERSDLRLADIQVDLATDQT